MWVVGRVASWGRAGPAWRASSTPRPAPRATATPPRGPGLGAEARMAGAGGGAARAEGLGRLPGGRATGAPLRWRSSASSQHSALRAEDASEPYPASAASPPASPPAPPLGGVRVGGGDDVEDAPRRPPRPGTRPAATRRRRRRSTTAAAGTAELRLRDLEVPAAAPRRSAPRAWAGSLGLGGRWRGLRRGAPCSTWLKPQSAYSRHLFGKTSVLRSIDVAGSAGFTDAVRSRVFLVVWTGFST